MASSLRKRLRNVEDFAPFLGMSCSDLQNVVNETDHGADQPPSAPQLDVVSHMCHVFRLGSSLCHLYNKLIPTFTDEHSVLFADLPAPPDIPYDMPNLMEAPEGVRNWAKRPANVKACKRYIATFIMAMTQRKEEGRWHGELWSLTELFGNTAGDDDAAFESYDSASLMKVFLTVEGILDNLPESSLTPTTPTTPFGLGGASLAGGIAPMTSVHSSTRQSLDGAGAGSTTPLLGNMTPNGVVNLDDVPGPASVVPSEASAVSNNAFKSVEELVLSERSYVQELEILERCSDEIRKAELISADTVYSMFSNLRQILDFQRKFLIKLETEWESIEEGGPSAWMDGRWGRPFVDMEKEFKCYGPYCAGFMDATKVVNDYMINLMAGQQLPEGQRPCLHPERELQAFMIKPVQRVLKYRLLLEAILHATAKHDYPHRAELEAGHAAALRIANDINETTDLKERQATVRELVERVDDWKGHDYERFGDLHLDDQFTVSKADSPREYHVFLFAKMMLCCKEVQVDKKSKGSKNGNMLRKDKTNSKPVNVKPRLALKGRIFVSNVTAAHLLPPTEPFGVSRVQIVWTVPSKTGEGPEDIEDSFIMSGRTEEQMKKWADKVMELANAARREKSIREHARTGSHSQRTSGPYWAQSTFAPPTPAAEHSSFPLGSALSPTYGPGELPDEDDRGLPPASNLSGLGMYNVPGVGPQVPTNRRVQSQQSLPSVAQADVRQNRAMTEDQSGPNMVMWKNMHTAPPLPALPHIGSAPSSAVGSEASWGHGPRRQMTGTEDMHMPPAAYQQQYSQGPRGPGSRQMSQPAGQPPRNRSVSSPNVHQQAQLPPMSASGSSSSGWGPTSNGNAPYPTGSNSSSSTGLGSTPGGTAYFTRRESNGKRTSQESETTETSDSSSQSPRTPYTNATPGDLRGATPVSRQNSQENGAAPATVLVKVRSGESNFVIGIASDVQYRTLYEKVVKKLRLCSARHANADLDVVVKIKWLDSDGDEVVIKTDMDVQTMLAEAGTEQIQLIAT